MSDTTTITVREEAGVALAPAPMVNTQDVKSLMQMATTLFNSGMLPSRIKSGAAAFAIIVAGQELGIPAMTSLRTIHLVEGKPTLDAGLMLGLANQRGVQHEWLENGENGIAKIKLTSGSKSYTGTFTMDDARGAGLLGKDVWKKYPAAMLRARAASAAVRAFAPGLLVGVYTPEEAESFEKEPVDLGNVKTMVPEFDFDMEIKKLGLSAPTVRDFLKSVGAPDPDAPSNGPRLLKRLASEEGRNAYEKWLGEQAPANNNEGEGANVHVA